ncbi:MAG: Fic family protein [Acidimicrobiia bacterium]|nr:Fic family protein [Acidimicrobiia bacterium]
MGRYVSRYWHPRLEAPSARERRGGWYEAYVPDHLAGWVPRLSVDVIATASAAESAVERLNRRVVGTGPHPLDTFAYVLLRVEAVASSRIEGIEVSPRRLLTAEAEHRAGGRSSDRTAAEVLGNLEAMEEAIRSAATDGPLRTADLLEVHRRLMSVSPHPELGGWIRDIQNWIGASAYSPLGASFVPPVPEEVPPLVSDLMAYVNRTDLPPLIQAGIAHAQFETIHPFADGNGRTGRALIHAILRRREVAPAFVPPISAVLARSTDSYIDGLSAWRHTGSADDPARDHAVEQWLGMFLEAAYDACYEAHSYLDAVADLEAELRSRVGAVRRGSSADRLLSLLAARPIFSVDSAAKAIERSTVATGHAVNQLTELGILTVRSIGKQRYRIFEAPDVTRLITRLDRELSIQGPAA